MLTYTFVFLELVSATMVLLLGLIVDTGTKNLGIEMESVSFVELWDPLIR